MKRIGLFLAFVLFTSHLSIAQWIGLDGDKTSTEPQISFLRQSENELVMQLHISGFNKSTLEIKGQEYHNLDLGTESFTQKTGAPKVPVVSTLVAIPDNTPVQLEVLSEGTRYTFTDINLPPARESWWEKSEESSYVTKAEYYQNDSYYPGQFAKIGKPQVFRDFRIVRVEWHPIRYNPVSKKAEVISSLKIRLSFDGHGEVINPRTAPVRPIAPSFIPIYKSIIANYDSFRQTRDLEDEGQDLMLCIMPDEFYESFQPYAEWKRRSGINVVVKKFSDIGANSNNPITIKNFISDAYHNWDIPPTYVLVVGDKGVFPVKYISYDYTFVYDDYFVEVDGNDFFPEMMIGRFTNQGDYRMRVMINKFKQYEETPYIDDPDWFMKGICCSNDAFASQIETKSYTRNLMLNEGGFISVDAMMSDSNFNQGNCSYDVNDVIIAINEGRSFLNYRGEGWTTGWWASCYQFGVDDVSSLNNGRKLTFFTSIGCGVAMFDADGGNCFGEALIQKGNLTQGDGAIAFIGPTSNTHTTYNNKIDKGIYKGMFQEDMDTPGQALLRGKMYMYNVFGESGEWTEYQFRVFHVLGDPSIHIWKKIPKNVTVNHAASIAASENSTNIHVTYQNNNTPVAGARVTLTGDNGFFAMGITDTNGDVTVSGLDSSGLNQYQVTVTGKDVYPYQGTMDITAIGVQDYISGIDIQTFPNPFESGKGINIQLQLDRAEPVHIYIYTLSGQIIRTFMSDSIKTHQDFYWNGRSDTGQYLNPGVYFARIITGDKSKTVKLLMQ
jgi:hypothetical protein